MGKSIKKQVTLDLSGKVVGKKNNYRRGRGKGFYKSPELMVFEEDALWQIKGQTKNSVVTLPLEKPLEVVIDFFISRNNKDIDNMCGTIFDILQKSGVIKNDLLIETLTVHKIKDCELDYTKILIQEL